MSDGKQAFDWSSTSCTLIWCPQMMPSVPTAPLSSRGWWTSRALLCAWSPVCSPCLRDGAFPWQRLAVLQPLSRLRHQGTARGRHSCCRAVRVVTLAAKISFLVGRFFFLVPLLAFLNFFFFCLPHACHSLLLPAWSAAGLPACRISSFPLPMNTLPCDQPALSQTRRLPSANPCWSTPRSTAALGSPQHFTVPACLCSISAPLSLFKKVWHQKGSSVCLCSRRLFKAACCIFKKCFHQVISSLPSCIFFHRVPGNTPNLLLCAKPFALCPCSAF